MADSESLLTKAEPHSLDLGALFAHAVVAVVVVADVLAFVVASVWARLCRVWGFASRCVTDGGFQTDPFVFWPHVELVGLRICVQ